MYFIDTSVHGRAFQHLPGAPVGTPSIKVQKLVKDTQKQALPACLEDRICCQIFEAVINWRIAHLTSAQSDKLCHELGIMYFGSGQSVIDRVTSLNVTRVDRARVIGKLLDIYPERLFSVFPQSNTVLQDFMEDSRIAIPQNLTVNGEVFYLYVQDLQHDYRGFVAYAALAYRANSGKNFIVLAARTLVDNFWGKKVPTITLGEAFVPNWPLGMAEIDKNPYSVVLLCLDLRLALTLRSKVKRASLAGTDTIVSGILGGDEGVKITDFKVLTHHHVVVIPKFSKDGFKTVKDVHKHLRAVNATVTVFWHPLQNEADVQSEGDSWMDEVCSSSTNIDRVEDVTALLARIVRDAESLDNFMARCHNWGIVKEARDTVLDVQADRPRVVGFHDLRTSPATLYKPDLMFIFRVGQISLVWGASNSGKSLIVASFAIAIGAGIPLLGIPNSATSRKVLIVDGELEQGELHSRIDQLATAHDVVSAKDNLFFIPTRSYDPSLCDLVSGTLAKTVCDCVKANGIDVVIIDNLITLAPSAARGNEDALFALVRDIERAGAAVILVHHATKEGGSFKGSSNLASKSQNIIRIEGRDTLVQEGDDSAQIADALSTEGALVRMTWQKCKKAPGLEGTSKVFKLPIGGAWYEVVDELPAADAEPVTDEIGISASEEAAQPLTSDEKSVMALFAKDRVSIKRNDVEEVLGCKEDKALTVLKALKDKNLIKSDGAGRSTGYSLM